MAQPGENSRTRSRSEFETLKN